MEVKVEIFTGYEAVNTAAISNVLKLTNEFYARGLVGRVISINTNTTESGGEDGFFTYTYTLTYEPMYEV